MTVEDAVIVVSLSADDDVLGRIGDARQVADRLGWRVIGVRFEGADRAAGNEPLDWIHHGADEVRVVRLLDFSQAGLVAAAAALWAERPPRLVISAADAIGRPWSARLAARMDWQLVSPALLVRVQDRQLTATRLNATGERACQERLPAERPALVALRPGVARSVAANAARRGPIHCQSLATPGRNPVRNIEHIAANPATEDIRHLERLIAGGRGVGSRSGFDRLRRVAARLGAGLAASRKAVDLGWIEPQRQVGQTGRSVKPRLYVACGISGASHHWEGMSDSRHIVAINTDAAAPLMKRAHLALCAELHEVLRHLETLLNETA